MKSARSWSWSFNTMRLKQNGQHFTNDIFKHIFFNENVWILIKISLKFVPKGQIHNIPVLVQIIAWRHPGGKPLYEAMIVSLPMSICVFQPQWVNTLSPEQNGQRLSDRKQSGRRHIQLYFWQIKVLYFDANFTIIYSKSFNCQQFSIISYLRGT